MQQDLLSVPEEYKGFANVFSKRKADTLAPHQPYDLKINLLEGQSPPPGLVYSLSQSELSELCEFLDEHLIRQGLTQLKGKVMMTILT